MFEGGFHSLSVSFIVYGFRSILCPPLCAMMTILNASFSGCRTFSRLPNQNRFGEFPLTVFMLLLSYRFIPSFLFYSVTFSPSPKTGNSSRVAPPSIGGIIVDSCFSMARCGMPYRWKRKFEIKNITERER